MLLSCLLRTPFCHGTQTRWGCSEHTLSPRFPHTAVRYVPSRGHAHALRIGTVLEHGVCRTSLLPPRAGRQRQGQRGNSGIPVGWPFHLYSALPLPWDKTSLQRSCPQRGRLQSQRCLKAGPRFPPAPWQTAGTGQVNTLDTPLPSCQLAFELLLRLQFPTSSCLHPGAGGFASS